MARPRPRYLLLAWLTVCALAPRASAHPGDLSTQVILTIDIAPDGVTQRVMVPLQQALIDYYGGMSYEAYAALDPDDADRRLTAAHTRANPVFINGQAALPTITGREVTTQASAIPDFAIPPDEFLDHAFLAYTAAYPTPGQPSRVEWVWGTFAFDRFRIDDGTLGAPLSADSPRSSLVAELTANGKTTLRVFSPDEPANTWHGETASPHITAYFGSPRTAQATPLTPYSPGVSLWVLTLGAVGIVLVIGLAALRQWGAALLVLPVPLAAAALGFWFAEGGKAPPAPAPAEPAPITRPADADAVATFTALHRNIYTAFDYNADSDIYDALALSVAGPELEAVYRAVYTSLIQRNQGGAVGKVQAVDILEATVVEPDPAALEDGDDPAVAFAVHCRWTVRGIVSHFGHTHERLNTFDATYTLAPRGGSWRIVGSTMHTQKRLDRPGEDDAEPTLDEMLGEAG